MPVIPEFERQRQKGQELKVTLAWMSQNIKNDKRREQTRQLVHPPHQLPPLLPAPKGGHSKRSICKS